MTLLKNSQGSGLAMLTAAGHSSERMHGRTIGGGKTHQGESGRLGEGFQYSLPAVGAAQHAVSARGSPSETLNPRGFIVG